MSRHRNVRTMNYDDDYEGYYDVYGRSQEEDSCISPTTEEQFLYNRDKLHSMSSFLSPEVLQEENEEDDEEEDGAHKAGPREPELSPVDEVRLYECIEKMQNVVGDSIPEATLRRVALEGDFNAEVALDRLLQETDKPKPQREPRKRERKPLTPLEQVGAPVRAAGANKELLPAVDPALRQTFPRQPQPDVEDRRSKASSETLKVPSATSSNRSSPDLDRKEPSPEAAGDTQPADGATPKTPRSKPPKDVAAEYAKERGSTKSLLNLVVIGHVDAGKSTLMGHLLYRLGCVQKKQMHKYEQESKKLGKASFMYAWVLDETSEERNRGITMDVAQAKFETPNRSIVLLDAPGHRDFIPNMITGAAQADVAILVVDATRGEFETGFEMGGQTREHTLLVRSLGVSQLAVAINKLDNVSWDEGRYNEITAKLRTFLRQAGYRESDFTFVPCSGLTGENLTTKPEPGSPLTKWYTGPCLVDVIDSFKPPERPVSKPFRLCVSDVFKGQGSGFCVSGRIDAGCAANGDKVLVMPAAEQGTVKGITIDELPVTQAFAGDQVALTLAGVDMIKVTTGSFLCDPTVPIRVSTRFQARLVVFNVEVPLTRGFPVVLHYQSTTEQASIHRILSQLNKVTGEVVRNKPRCLVKNTSGLVEIKVSRPICVELYKEFKELGRITLRSGGSTVAAGVITEVM
ncbi:translation elongation factor EF-1alpha (GTPase) HBS1 isoform X2 [Dermacentor variabilis]|uniref:translation elongation factor EF-1alpha (GTPase) HBS1 isoform X2 n=1 Tax=Dermacentor variabilis TaxID=34621 RepID=UPI003F5AF09B